MRTDRQELLTLALDIGRGLLYSALSGNDSQRNIKYAPLDYNEDGSIKKVMK
ncbi:MAG: hypothetical protein PWP10_4367 [Clostridiales bacterium]|jgi:hypothetical protein|nr:hypothetical protein [Clostridiales bacterium]